METLQFTPNRQQKKALEGLAYWIADNRYMREKYGDHEPELKVIHDTIHAIFNELDALGIPLWVQNSIIICAENWRRYHEVGITADLKARGIAI